MVKRRITTGDGIVDVEQQSRVRIINGKKWFKHYEGKQAYISELKTGFRLPGMQTWVAAEKFLSTITEDKLESVLNMAKSRLKNMGIEFPVNKEDS